jgi:hypothetical protein
VGVDVDWVTKNKKNSDYFVVERSLNGDSGFDSVGEVQAAGNSSELQSYYLKDQNSILGEINYYRLKQVDLDGKIQYSNVKSVYVSFGENAMVYPNPSNGSFRIKFEDQYMTGYMIVSITNLLGQQVYAENVQVHDGKIDIQNHKLVSGMYMLEIQNSDGEQLFSTSISIK